MSTYAGIDREIPILPFNVAAASTLVRGMVVQWNNGTKVVEPMSVSTNVAVGVCTGDADLTLLQVDVYVSKGCTVLIKCNTGIVPGPFDLLYWAASGVVTNIAAGAAFARAVGTGFNGFVEATML